MVCSPPKGNGMGSIADFANCYTMESHVAKLAEEVSAAGLRDSLLHL